VQTFGRDLNRSGSQPAAAPDDEDTRLISGAIGFALGVAAERKRRQE
jgi:hypothetical protein